MYTVKKIYTKISGGKIPVRILGVLILLLGILLYFIFLNHVNRNNLLTAQTIENSVSLAFAQIDDLMRNSENIVIDNEDYFLSKPETNQNISVFKVARQIGALKAEKPYIEKIAFYRRNGKTVVTDDGVSTKELFFQYEYSTDNQTIEFWDSLLESYSSPTIIGVSEYKVPSINAFEHKRIFVIPRIYMLYDVGVLVFVNEANFLEYCGLGGYDGEVDFSMYNGDGEYVLGDIPDKATIETDVKGTKFSPGMLGQFVYRSWLNFEDLIITIKRPAPVPHLMWFFCALAVLAVLIFILHFMLLKRTRGVSGISHGERSALYSCMLDKSFYTENEKLNDAVSKGYSAFVLCAVICRDVGDRQGFSSEIEKLIINDTAEDSRIVARQGNALVILVKMTAEPDDVSSVISSKVDSVMKRCSKYSSPELVCGKLFYSMKEISSAYKRLWDRIQEKGVSGEEETSIRVLSNRFKLQLVEYIAGGKFTQLTEIIRQEAMLAVNSGIPNRVFPFYLAHIYFEVAEAFKDDNEFVNSTWKMFFENMEYMRNSFNCDSMINILQNTFIDIRPNILKNSGGNVRIAEIIDYINKNYSKELYLDSIAEHFSMLPKPFSAFFKNQAGIGFVEYLTRLRIEKAKELLTKTNKSIAEISDEVGYNTKTTFTMAFKKYTGESPGQFREKK